MNQGYLVRMYFNALKQNLAKKEGMEQTYVVVCFKSLGHVLEPALCTTWEMKRRVRTPDSMQATTVHSDPKLRISFGNCWGKLRHLDCLMGV